jgi:hypothetical protein
MLWRASGNPASHPLFIDFTIWATAAHALVMLIATPIQKGLVMTVIEGLPLLVIAAVLWWLRPRGTGEGGRAAGKGAPLRNLTSVIESHGTRRQGRAFD